jgi:hypothetical protein
MTTSPPSFAVVVKSGNINFMEASGPLQACNGNALFGPKKEEITGKRRKIHNEELNDT